MTTKLGYDGVKNLLYALYIVYPELVDSRYQISSRCYSRYINNRIRRSVEIWDEDRPGVNTP